MATIVKAEQVDDVLHLNTAVKNRKRRKNSATGGADEDGGGEEVEAEKQYCISDSFVASSGCARAPTESPFLRTFQVDLVLDEQFELDALRLLKETKLHLTNTSMGALSSGTEEEMSRIWNACILYCTSRLRNRNLARAGSSSSPSFLTLSQLLKATKVGVWDFFRELPHFVQKSEHTLTELFGDSCGELARVKEVQAKFELMSDLFSYYKRIFRTLFMPIDSIGNGNTAYSVHLRFGWMLFLALRTHVLSHFMDLVTCTNGLIAVLVILVIHMPTQYRKCSLDDNETFAIRCPNGVKVTASLCNVYSAFEQDVALMVIKANDMICEILHIHPSQIGEKDEIQLKDIDKDGICFFNDLMEGSSLPGYLESLDRDYEEHHYKKAELDERVFLTEDALLMSESISPNGIISNSAKRKIEAISSPGRVLYKGSLKPWPGSPCPLSPMKSGSIKLPPLTPVTTTMTTAKWLRNLIAPLPSDPTPELVRFFKSCDIDTTKEVIHRAQVLLEAIFVSNNDRHGISSLSSWGVGSQGGFLMDSAWAKHRRLEALKLYYRVLGSICRAESRRLRSHNLSSLLRNERFQRCMLACSAELVLAAHKTIHMAFPAVLAPTGITPFDLSKVIESFVRHEETLPRELKRHLNSIEVRLLESLAWQKGSSMYNSLIVAKPKLQAEITRLQLLANPLTSLDALSLSLKEVAPSLLLPLPNKLDSLSGESKVEASPGIAGPVVSGSTPQDQTQQSILSPIKERTPAIVSSRNHIQPPLQSAFASPQRPSPSGAGETCAETGIAVLFEKVLKLMAIRIKMMMEGLKQPHYMMEEVYRMAQYALQQQTSLFFNRHIDQIVLCCIYGVCKVNRVNLTFKSIVTEYKKQPECKSETFRAVVMDSPSAKQNGKMYQDTGDIIRFYNEVFVPTTKNFLIQLSSNVACAPTNSRGMKDPNELNGESPESPKQSTFPTLPDMSPKKVSANHNVYVSPLRSSKMDSLVSSPCSRRFYACVGESTRAFQSPSKDLKEINNRLSSSRRFGSMETGNPGLVSDSLVMGTLNPFKTGAVNGGSTSQLTSDSLLSLSQSHSWRLNSTSASHSSPSKRPCTD